MKEMTLKEMQKQSVEQHPGSLGLFRDPSITNILNELDLTPSTAVSKIMRECGQFSPLYEEEDEMQAVITDFFNDNETNFLRVDAVLNKRDFEPLENYSKIEEAHKDVISEDITYGQRTTTNNMGKTKKTVTPGDITDTSIEHRAIQHSEFPRVAGEEVPGSRSMDLHYPMGPSGETEPYSQQDTRHQLASTEENEQITVAENIREEVVDGKETTNDIKRRNVHGTLTVFLKPQDFATAELQYILKYRNTLDFIIKMFISNCLIAVY